MLDIRARHAPARGRLAGEVSAEEAGLKERNGGTPFCAGPTTDEILTTASAFLAAAELPALSEHDMAIAPSTKCAHRGEPVLRTAGPS